MDYKKEALRTKSNNYGAISERLSMPSTLDLLHSSLGLCTEASEFADVVKKHIYYGKELDIINLEEELGDICWYMAIAMEALDVDFNCVMNRNIAKLRSRYPEKFSEDKAQNRDIEKEREQLELFGK